MLNPTTTRWTVAVSRETDSLACCTLARNCI